MNFCHIAKNCSYKCCRWTVWISIYVLIVSLVRLLCIYLSIKTITLQSRRLQLTSSSTKPNCLNNRLAYGKIANKQAKKRERDIPTRDRKKQRVRLNRVSVEQHIDVSISDRYQYTISIGNGHSHLIQCKPLSNWLNPYIIPISECNDDEQFHSIEKFDWDKYGWNWPVEMWNMLICTKWYGTHSVYVCIWVCCWVNESQSHDCCSNLNVITTPWESSTSKNIGFQYLTLEIFTKICTNHQKRERE